MPQRRAPAGIKHKKAPYCAQPEGSLASVIFATELLSPSSNRRRPSIINPALSSRGSSHNMSPRVILTFSFFFLPSPCIVFRCRRLITQICRFFHLVRCEREKPLIYLRLPCSPSQRPWTEKSYSEQRQREGVLNK